MCSEFVNNSRRIHLIVYLACWYEAFPVAKPGLDASQAELCNTHLEGRGSAKQKTHLRKPKSIKHLMGKSIQRWKSKLPCNLCCNSQNTHPLHWSFTSCWRYTNDDSRSPPGAFDPWSVFSSASLCLGSVLFKWHRSRWWFTGKLWAGSLAQGRLQNNKQPCWKHFLLQLCAPKAAELLSGSNLEEFYQQVQNQCKCAAPPGLIAGEHLFALQYPKGCLVSWEVCSL